MKRTENFPLASQGSLPEQKAASFWTFSKNDLYPPPPPPPPPPPSGDFSSLLT